MNSPVSANDELGIVGRLLNARPVPFRGMNGQTIPKEHGVYAIVNCGTGEFLWVGKSDRAKDGLQSRIWVQHRTANESSDLVQILINDDDVGVETPVQARNWMETHCAVHYLAKEQLDIDIDQAEHIITAALQPKYNIQ